jgi:hypothetical protein
MEMEFIMEFWLRFNCKFLQYFKFHLKFYVNIGSMVLGNREYDQYETISVVTI